ncbi:FtsW/RodA/SpoVE family cell cycle protein [Alteribacillus bidgolensis]|uniref:Rod shape determining protein RodA n=1 Tax=Alteribacillus bidgolensis TaxID=930129 RepID=A0A1G8MMG2_9BACI|nr:FtsW/RodA/SpoVE family cell cycle protein [Alteribacillus bidgolensis]SDI68985.1 rod shape determining protein RodA [Alteribacillus bidgolensis]
MSVNQEHDKYDVNLLFVLFLFSIASCISIYYAQDMGQYDANFVLRQAVFYVIAFLVAFIVLHFDFEYYNTRLAWILYGFGLALLLLLAVSPASIAPLNNGAKSWFELPVIGSFQPSELMKIFVVITLSHLISNHNQQFHHTMFNDLKLIGKMTAATIPPILLLMNQPDMGMVILTLSIFITLIIVSGISYKIIAVIIGVPALGITSFIFAFFRFPDFVEKYFFSNLSSYQVERFYGWLNPFEFVDAGYQTAQALTLIGTGGMFGRKSNVYVPEAHTDFIFAIIGHIFGFVGGAFVITLYFILLYFIIMTALKTYNLFGMYMCSGIIGMLAFQVFQNVGMNIGLLPVTGFTLPLVSYGGSSLLTTMLAIGLVMSVRYHSKTFMFTPSSEP